MKQRVRTRLKNHAGAVLPVASFCFCSCWARWPRLFMAAENTKAQYRTSIRISKSQRKLHRQQPQQHRIPFRDLKRLGAMLTAIQVPGWLRSQKASRLDKEFPARLILLSLSFCIFTGALPC